MLQGCVSVTMLSSPKSQQLDVICRSGTSDVQFLEPASSGAAIAAGISDAPTRPKLSLRSKMSFDEDALLPQFWLLFSSAVHL
jgi:hypothetical protein